MTAATLFHNVAARGDYNDYKHRGYRLGLRHSAFGTQSAY